MGKLKLSFDLQAKVPLHQPYVGTGYLWTTVRPTCVVQAWSTCSLFWRNQSSQNSVSQGASMSHRGVTLKHPCSSPHQGNLLPIQALPTFKQAWLEQTAKTFRKAATHKPAWELWTEQELHRTAEPQQEPQPSKTTSLDFQQHINLFPSSWTGNTTGLNNYTRLSKDCLFDSVGCLFVGFVLLWYFGSKLFES